MKVPFQREDEQLREGGSSTFKMVMSSVELKGQANRWWSISSQVYVEDIPALMKNRWWRLRHGEEEPAQVKKTFGELYVKLLRPKVLYVEISSKLIEEATLVKREILRWRYALRWRDANVSDEDNGT